MTISKFARNSDKYQTWDKAASTFWQQARNQTANREQTNINKKIEPLECEQSHNFWEELASQRASS